MVAAAVAVLCPVVVAAVALVMAVSAYGLDIERMEPIADRSIRTGNKVLYEKNLAQPAETQLPQQQQQSSASTNEYLDVNEIPVRYDEAQLWRIYNISSRMRNEMPVAQTLENKYGGTVWKENSKFLDISIGREHLKSARSFLASQNLQSELLNGNIQELIDAELLEDVQANMNETAARSKRATSSGMNWKQYHDLQTIYAFMREIRGKFPNICRLYTIGKTSEGRDLKVLRISENPRENKKIWIDGGIHAREWISPATVTYILFQLMANWQEQPAYIKNKTWYIMPVMNPDGYAYSRKVNRLWRKNRAPSKRSDCVGVDLNRNFNIGWSGYGSSTNPCSDTFRGTEPASELETKAVAKFLSKRRGNLSAYLTYHSYGQMVVYPWAYKAVKVRDSSELQRVGNTAVQRIEDKTGFVYKAAVTHEVLGIAGGGSDDWSRDALQVKYVYTIELRDRGQHGFVLPAAQILGTAKEGHIIAETVAQAITS